MSEEKSNQENGEIEIVEVDPLVSPSENYVVVGQLQRMPALFARGLLHLTLLVLFTAVVYSLAAKIDVVVESRAVARPVRRHPPRSSPESFRPNPGGVVASIQTVDSFARQLWGRRS